MSGKYILVDYVGTKGFEEAVNRRLQEGYRLYGNTFVDNYHHYQAMYKPDETDEMNEFPNAWSCL